MKRVFTTLAAAAAIAIGATPALAADKTWYVYCEGNSRDAHWAVFSKNFWPHPLTEGYGRRVGSAAKAFFESRHDVELEGCAAVSFVNSSLAQHSRTRTAQLHERMGDEVFYFQLPRDALPTEVVATPQRSVRVAEPVVAVPSVASKAGEPRPVVAIPTADR